MGICRSIEHPHVKSNLVQQLHRMSTYGNLELGEFKGLFSDEDYKKCENRKLPGAWYPLTSNVFIQFLHWVSILYLQKISCICVNLNYLFHIDIPILYVQQEIAVISNAAMRTYYEKTKMQDRTPKGVHDAMTQAATTAIKGF